MIPAFNIGGDSSKSSLLNPNTFDIGLWVIYNIIIKHDMVHNVPVHFQQTGVETQTSSDKA